MQVQYDNDNFFDGVLWESVSLIRAKSLGRTRNSIPFPTYYVILVPSVFIRQLDDGQLRTVLLDE